MGGEGRRVTSDRAQELEASREGHFQVEVQVCGRVRNKHIRLLLTEFLTLKGL